MSEGIVINKNHNMEDVIDMVSAITYDEFLLMTQGTVFIGLCKRSDFERFKERMIDYLRHEGLRKESSFNMINELFGIPDLRIWRVLLALYV